MVLPPEYIGREPAFIKHELLRQYLERLAFNVLSSYDDFAYVDGFSGPWESQKENFGDTSFMIALRTLRKVKKILAENGRDVRIRCLFIENDKKTYEKLKSAVTGYDGIDDIQTKNGAFELLVEDVVKFIGRSYALVFLDPKGWSDTPYTKIARVLSYEPGEVVINFMYEFANRALPQERHQKDFDEWFGHEWFFSAL